MIQVGQYYFGDSGVKWVSFQLVLTDALTAQSTSMHIL